MFALHCAACEVTYLVDTHSLISLYNTRGGPVAYAHCPRGHPNVVHFREGQTQAGDDIDRDGAA